IFVLPTRVKDLCHQGWHRLQRVRTYRSARGPEPEEVCSAKRQPSGGLISKLSPEKLQINNALLPSGSDRSSFSQRASSFTSTRSKSLRQFDRQGVRLRSEMRSR